jgi:hypothetical protein
VRRLLCWTSADNPAKRSEFPSPTNRYGLLMALVYHAIFRAPHLPSALVSAQNWLRNRSRARNERLARPRASNPPKSNSPPTTRQPDAPNSSTEIVTPTAESAKGGRASDARFSVLAVHMSHHACANHLHPFGCHEARRARTQAAEARLSSKHSLSGEPGRRTIHSRNLRRFWVDALELHLAKFARALSRSLACGVRGCNIRIEPTVNFRCDR